MCIDVDRNVIIKDEDDTFDAELAEIKKNSKGCFVTVLVIHDLRKVPIMIERREGL